MGRLSWLASVVAHVVLKWAETDSCSDEKTDFYFVSQYDIVTEVKIKQDPNYLLFTCLTELLPKIDWKSSD